MKFFVDTADVKEIRELNDLGLLDGVTTNPSLILKSGRNIAEVTKEICDIVEGPVSAEVTATEYDEHDGARRKMLAKIADNICIKVPLTLDGLKACKAIRSETAAWSTSRSASPPTRRCSPPRPARASSRPSSAASTTSASTAWS